MEYTIKIWTERKEWEVSEKTLVSIAKDIANGVIRGKLSDEMFNDEETVSWKGGSSMEQRIAYAVKKHGDNIDIIFNRTMKV